MLVCEGTKEEDSAVQGGRVSRSLLCEPNGSVCDGRIPSEKPSRFLDVGVEGI